MSDRLTPVLAAITTRAGALGLTLAGVAVPVYQRRADVRRRGLDPAEMITVAKSPTPEELSRRRFGLWQTKYYVAVILRAPYGGPDAATDEHDAARDTIVDAFKRPPLPGAPDVFELNARPADWLRPEGGKTEWDWWCVEVEATVAHS